MAWKPDSVAARDKAAGYRRAATQLVELTKEHYSPEAKAYVVEVTPKEAEILLAASAILGRLAKGKDTKKAEAQRIEERKNKLEALAATTVEQCFADWLDFNLPNLLAIAVQLRPGYGWESPTAKMREMVRDAAEPCVFPSGRLGSPMPIKSAIKYLRREIVSTLNYKIRSAVEESTGKADPGRGDARAALAEATRIRAALESALPAVVEQHKASIDAVVVRAIADQLEQANAKSQLKGKS